MLALNDTEAAPRAATLDDLVHMQATMRARIAALPREDVATQYHPDLSPLGWHLGHCAMVERHWLRERLLGEPADDGLHALYFPENSTKNGRGPRLPGRDELVEWVQAEHARHLALLAEPPAAVAAHPLMGDDYLLHFLHQHYAQHVETMHCVLARRTAVQDPAQEVGAVSPDAAPAATEEPAADTVTLAAGACRVGADEVRAYDNERPAHSVEVGPTRLQRRPVTHAQWRAFIADAGYAADACWSEAGRAWRDRHGIDRPAGWVDRDGCRIATPEGIVHGAAADPVFGISHHEARAFAAWAGGRLPHEHEWEAAARNGLLQGTGTAWEWCANALFPYPGFRPFPYDGYSLPWFDGNHYVLRGGSAWSRPVIRRASFRDFFEPDKRHRFAGCRLAFDA